MEVNSVMEYMRLFADNWYIIVAFICAIILSVSKIVEFLGYPTERKQKEIRARLLSFVTEAELELGSKTGELKLAQVYDYFCDAFPYTKKWVSYEQFEDLVDEVLPTMRKILENKNIELIEEGE
jgi:hypothetical protein